MKYIVSDSDGPIRAFKTLRMARLFANSIKGAVITKTPEKQNKDVFIPALW